MTSDCLFCKLRDVTDNIVYQDSDFYVIVDRSPMSNRHVLVIPKTHCAVLTECDDGVLSKILILAKKLVKKLQLDKYNLIQNNVNQQAIHHLHLHLVGCNETGSFQFRTHSSLELSDEEYKKIVEEVKVLLKE